MVYNNNDSYNSSSQWHYSYTILLIRLQALQPLVKTFPGAGEVSKTIFALGIIGTGLLAIPVLAGPSGYALSDVFGWKQGLSKTLKQAKSFHVVIAGINCNWSVDKFCKYRSNNSASIQRYD